ncbi:MAG: hypothetical protein AAGF15_08275 [Pseudomonadota bacterium]
MTARAGFLIWAIVLILFGLIGYTRQTFNVQTSYLCLMAKVRSDTPPPDIMFLGSSRIGSAIDPVYVQQKLSKALDRPDLTVEKFAILASQPMQYVATVKEMLANRGAPDVVVMLPPYGIVEERVFDGNRLFWGRTAIMTDLDILEDIKTSFHAQDPLPLWRRISHADWQSMPEIWLKRASEMIYAAVAEVPRRANNDIVGCPDDRRDSLVATYTWPYGTISDDADPREHPDMFWLDADGHEEAQKTADQHLSFDASSEERQLEVAAIETLVKALETAGADTIFTLMPTYGREAVEPVTKTSLKAAFPDTPLVDSYDAFEGLDLDTRRETFRDSKHFNLIGGKYISQFWVKTLEARLK